ncbi:hypothetical protein ABR737_18680 [Streptomyces sp. Edi2]|uniref:hypothetical protein n=1 Tax=Streptomyces sp. Edi2 TaxID=3162528 RepID=UPI0033062429
MLEALRKRGDCNPPEHPQRAHRPGYSAGKVQSHENGPTGVSFLIEASPLCLEGTMHRRTTQADTSGGYPDYPDHYGCDVPSGGH